MDNKLKYFIIHALRRCSYRWRPRGEAKAAARISRGIYVCNICKEQFRDKEVQVDHIIPVVSTEGFTTFDEYIERMFPQIDGFQVVCKPCHKEKTSNENLERKMHKKSLTNK